MRRLTRGRAATDDEAAPQASAASEPVSATPDAQQGGSGVPAFYTATGVGTQVADGGLPWRYDADGNVVRTVFGTLEFKF